MTNTTNTSDQYAYDAGTVVENVVIGSAYLLVAIGVTVINLPCLYVLVHEKDMWKNSCIKVSELDDSDVDTPVQTMVFLGVADQTNMLCNAFFGICTIAQIVDDVPYW
ncbi:unnamed protein product [Sphagnum balticum]